MDVGERRGTEVVDVVGVEADGDVVAHDLGHAGRPQHGGGVRGGRSEQGEGPGRLVVDVAGQERPDPGDDLGPGGGAGGAGGGGHLDGDGAGPGPVAVGDRAFDPVGEVGVDGVAEGIRVGGQGGGVVGGVGAGVHPVRMAGVDRPVPIVPGPGQESVWDYPRPPTVVAADAHVVVTHAGAVLADTRRALRVLETSQAPAYYLPADDIDLSLLRAAPGVSFCEWKGLAHYADVVVPGVAVVRQAAWTYPDPVPAYAALVGHWAIYPQLVERCTVDGEVARPMDGGVYGGWVTGAVVGPIKGGPGTAHW